MRPKIVVALVAMAVALGVCVGVLVHDDRADRPEPAGRSLAASTRAVPAPEPALELGHLVPGGIEPVMVGDDVAEHVRRGYLVADESPCDGGTRYWSWADPLPDGLVVSATEDGAIQALGSSTAAVNAGDVGVGSTMADLTASYGEFLNPITSDDVGDGWAWVSEQGRWIGFDFGPADRVTATSPVVFVEVGAGRFLHHFADAC